MKHCIKYVVIGLFLSTASFGQEIKEVEVKSFSDLTSHELQKILADPDYQPKEPITVRSIVNSCQIAAKEVNDRVEFVSGRSPECVCSVKGQRLEILCPLAIKK